MCFPVLRGSDYLELVALCSQAVTIVTMTRQMIIVVGRTSGVQQLPFLFVYHCTYKTHIQYTSPSYAAFILEQVKWDLYILVKKFQNRMTE